MAIGQRVQPGGPVDAPRLVSGPVVGETRPARRPLLAGLVGGPAVDVTKSTRRPLLAGPEVRPGHLGPGRVITLLRRLSIRVGYEAS